MLETEKNIPFIHNYCDRWCERCPFTNRCAVFAAEQETTDAEKDINNEAFWRNLINMFSEAQQLLTEKADDFGIDLNSFNEDKFAEQQRLAEEIISNETLTKLAAQYEKDSEKVLEAKKDWLLFSPLDEIGNDEKLSVIYWYQHFISAKMQRALSGILDFNGKEDFEELNDIESDANGSVKVGLIAIERSKNAWASLLAKENEEQIQPMIDLLEMIKQTAESKFPKARDFIRPGFDEVEVVM